MENFETTSDFSDVSNASNLSSLSSYRNEFLELRHLVNPSRYLLDRSSIPKPDGIDNDLPRQLQDSLQLNEKYKLELQNLEAKIELSFNDKIDDLLRNNRQLKNKLEGANFQIKQLIKSCDVNNAKEAITLEKQNQELQLYIDKLKKENDILLVNNRNLNVSLSETTAEVEVKNSTIQEFKARVLQQQVEVQNCLSDKAKLKNSVDASFFEVNRLEKSLDWYKQQLNECQNDKKVLFQDVLRHTNIINGLNNKISILSIDINKHKSDCNEIKIKALQEKQLLIQKLENVSNKTVSKEKLKTEPPKPVNYETIIDDLQSELSRIKLNLQEKENEFTKLIGENSNLMSKCLMQQNSLRQNEYTIEDLEKSKKELNKQLQLIEENYKEKCKEVQNLKSEVNALEIQLSNSKDEKLWTEKEILVVRERFKRFKENYDMVKCELQSANSQIQQLQKDKDITALNFEQQVTSLKNEIQNLTSNINQIKVSKNKIILEKENAIKEKTDDINKHETKICKLEASLEKLNNILTEKDVKLNLLQNSYNSAENKICSLEKNYIKMEEEYLSNVKGKDQNISELKIAVKSLTSLTGNTDDYKLAMNQEPQFSIEKHNSLSDMLPIKTDFNFNNIYFAQIETYLLEKLNFKSVQQKLTKYEQRIKNLEQLQPKQRKEDDLNNLQVLLKVKEREMKQHFKKYEENNRILLRKVKEHMKGRNITEKHLKRLQERYDSLLEENDSLKLFLKSKECENEIIQKLVEHYKRKNERLEANVCEKCINTEDIIQECQYYRKKCKFLTDNHNQLESFKLKVIDEKNCDSQLAQENKKLNEELTSKEKSNIELEEKLQMANFQIKKLSDEVVHLSANIQQKIEYIERIECIKDDLETELAYKGNETVTSLRHFQDEIKCLNSDKYFLQRLSNDLKMALRTCTEQNKLLRRQFLEKSQHSNSPTILDKNLESCGKYSDEFIMKLLEDHKDVSLNKETVNLSDYLNMLRKEIYSLQNQISKMS